MLLIGPKRARLLLRFGLCVSARRAGCAGRQEAQWRASRPPPRPCRGARCNRGAARWDRCRVGLSAGRAGATAMPPPPNRRTTRRKRAQPSGSTAVAAWVTTRGRLAYNKRGPRLQQAPLCLYSTGLLLVTAARSLVAISPRVISPVLRGSSGGYDGDGRTN